MYKVIKFNLHIAPLKFTPWVWYVEN